MSVKHRVDSLTERREQREREAALESATLLIFRSMAQSGVIPAPVALEHAPLFEVWNEGDIMASGEIRRCPENGKLYRYDTAPAPRLAADNGIMALTEVMELTTEAQAQPKTTKRGKPKPPSKSPDLWAEVV